VRNEPNFEEIPDEWVPPDGRWFSELDRKELQEAGLSESLLDYIDPSASKTGHYRLSAFATLLCIPAIFIPLATIPIFHRFAADWIISRNGLPEGTFVMGIGFLQFATLPFVCFLVAGLVVNLLMCRYWPGHHRYIAGYFLVRSIWAGKNRDRVMRAVEGLPKRDVRKLARRISYLEYSALTKWITGLSLMTIVLAWTDSHSFTAFTPTEIVRSTYFTLEATHYSYEDIEWIEVGCETGRRRPNAYYILRLRSGEGVRTFERGLNARISQRGISFVFRLDRHLRELNVPTYRYLLNPLLRDGRPAIGDACIQQIPRAYPGTADELLYLIRYDQDLPIAPR